MNTDTPKDRMLPVMEHFYTLQGEGCFSGQAAYFIRLAGCDVRCPWCDVKESWTATKEQWTDIRALIDQIPGQAPIAVVTGGEPLLRDLDELTALLQAKGLRTHLETSGSRALSGHWDWICVSPKEAKVPTEEVLSRADELKMVISDPDDLLRAEHYAARTKEGCVLLLQAEWDRRSEVTPLLTEYIQSHPRWRASVQIHKYMDIP